MKKILITMVMMALILSISSNVYAATGVITAGASTDEVEKGKAFTVTIAAAADAPIDAIYTKLNYDTTVLKELKKSDVEILEDSYSDNSLTGEIFLISDPYKTAPTSVTLCKINFTVLPNAKEGVTTISFDSSELHLNEKAEKVAIEEIDVVVKAKKQTNTNTNTNTNNTTNNKNNSTTNNNTNKNNVTTNKNNVDKDNKLPQTGLEEVNVVLVVALGIILIVTYISCRRYKDI